VHPVAPNLLLWEVSNLVLTAAKRGRLDDNLVSSLLAKLSVLPWEWEKPTHFAVMDATVAHARLRKLSAYDAAYLRLAMERNLSLATQDKALRAAAEAAGVDLVATE
jgi:predicted nucleic acid-binding protein